MSMNFLQEQLDVTEKVELITANVGSHQIVTAPSQLAANP